jgi:hypothetical protein
VSHKTVCGELRQERSSPARERKLAQRDRLDDEPGFLAHHRVARRLLGLDGAARRGPSWLPTRARWARM